MIKQTYQKLLLLLIVVVISFNSIAIVNAEQNSEIKTELLEKIEAIINWKKQTLEIDEQSSLFNNTFLKNAGDSTGDWYSLGIGRIGYTDNYEAYLAVLKDKITERYKTPEKLSDSKVTEWHRISLAILAMGGDPTAISEDEHGEPINLIADGVYYRDKVKSIGTQGLNAWIWALITLDSMRYSIPTDAKINREDIIVEIIKQQLTDGGFALHGEKSDTDMTAMSLTALAPYYNDETVYSYKQVNTGETVRKTVREVVNEALDTLSSIQLETAGFQSMGTENTESAIQVIVALSSLGINLFKDDRFIKNGQTIYDALVKFEMSDGGFLHSKEYDTENPTSKPDESNSMASEQTLYGLTALYRLLGNHRTLYDFRDEVDKDTKEKIQFLQTAIAEQSKKELSKKEVAHLFDLYKDIPAEERSYVYNYYELADMMERLNLKNDSEPLVEMYNIMDSGKPTIASLYSNEKHKVTHNQIEETDVDNVNELLGIRSTQHYIDVVTLIELFTSAENSDDFVKVKKQLIEEKKRIEQLQQKIDNLNELIIEQLYPFENLKIKDKRIVEEIIEAYDELSEFDQGKIVNYEDVEKSKAQIDSMVRTRIIMVVLISVMVISVMYLIYRRKKRKRQKEMIFEQSD